MITHVMDLRTSRWSAWDCEPEQAVIAAFEQDHRNANTWHFLPFANTWQDLPFDQHPNTRRGQYTVACGDFAAFWDRCPLLKGETC